MTILPKKKHQESKKNDSEFETEGRSRSRARSARERNRPPSDDLGATQDCSSTTGHNSASPNYEYADIDSIDSQDISSVPFKRTRHRPVNTGIYYMGATPAGSSPRSTGRRNSDDEQEGYNSSDEHGPHESDPNMEEVRNNHCRSVNFEANCDYSETRQQEQPVISKVKFDIIQEQ